MAYTTIDDPTKYFNTVLYSADASTNVSVTVGHQPDFVWIKRRNGSSNHVSFDSVRGTQKGLFPDITNAEATEGGSRGLTSFDSNGFTIGPQLQDIAGSINAPSGTYVSWNWKEDATAGFDIVSYTGNATARTISHSLSAVPHWMIVKPRESSSEGWSVYHHKIASDPETDVIRLDETNAAFDNSGYWNDTAPTSSVFSVGSDSATNHNSGGIIAYLWSEKKGFSKFGSFVGNANTDGPFVYTGFRPAWVLIKNSSANGENWNLFDNKRNGFNGSGEALRPNTNEAEYDRNVDFLANGFKVRDSSGEVSGSGNTLIYMAFAESPLVNSNGVPTNAR